MSHTVCAQCGSAAGTKVITKGSLLVEIFLWLLFLLPGLIYSIWRHASRTKGCRVCGSESIVPANSPVGRELLLRQQPNRSNPQLSTFSANQAPPVLSSAAPLVGVQYRRFGFAERFGWVLASCFGLFVLASILWAVASSLSEPANARKQTTALRRQQLAAAPQQEQETAPPDRIDLWRTLLNDRSLILELDAKRANDGGIVISGKVALPPEMKIWVQLLQAMPSGKTQVVAQCEAFIQPDCSFQSLPFSDKGNPIKEGSHLVEVVSYFNHLWQTKKNLVRVGFGGAHLPSGALVANDPEFPNEARHLSESRVLSFPGMSDEARAIAAVKKWKAQGAKNTVGAWISECESIYERADGKPQTDFKQIGWSASLGEGGRWTVTFECYDGGKRKKAEWTWNPQSDAVNYADPFAKSLSGLWSGALQLTPRSP
jgi:hypothetical protein